MIKWVYFLGRDVGSFSLAVLVLVIRWYYLGRFINIVVRIVF